MSQDGLSGIDNQGFEQQNIIFHHAMMRWWFQMPATKHFTEDVVNVYGHLYSLYRFIQFYTLSICNFTHLLAAPSYGPFSMLWHSI